MDIKKLDAKKVFHFISSVFLYSILVVIGLIAVMFTAYFIDQKIGLSKGESRAPLFGAYVIISESMVPKINVNDAVVTMRVSEKNIKVNDIITFLSKEIETQGTPITHRVIGIVYEKDNSDKVLGYRTKGDHNNTADFALISPSEVLGKVYLKIPFVGYVQSFLSTPIGFGLVIFIPCLLIIASDVLKIGKVISKEKLASDAPVENIPDNTVEVVSEPAVEVISEPVVEAFPTTNTDDNINSTSIESVDTNTNFNSDINSNVSFDNNNSDVTIDSNNSSQV